MDIVVGRLRDIEVDDLVVQPPGQWFAIKDMSTGKGLLHFEGMEVRHVTFYVRQAYGERFSIRAYKLHAQNRPCAMPLV